MTKTQIKSLKQWLTQERDYAAKASTQAYTQNQIQIAKSWAGQEIAYDNVLRRLVMNDFESLVETVKGEGK